MHGDDPIEQKIRFAGALGRFLAQPRRHGVSCWFVLFVCLGAAFLAYVALNELLG